MSSMIVGVFSLDGGSPLGFIAVISVAGSSSGFSATGVSSSGYSKGLGASFSSIVNKYSSLSSNSHPSGRLLLYQLNISISSAS